MKNTKYATPAHPAGFATAKRKANPVKRYIFLFPLTLLLLSSTACSKHTPTAAEINESIAQEKALKESQAAEEAKAAEDAKSQEDDKFLTEFGKAEKDNKLSWRHPRFPIDNEIYFL